MEFAYYYQKFWVFVSIVELKTAMKQKAFIPCVLTVMLMANSIFQGENIF